MGIRTRSWPVWSADDQRNRLSGFVRVGFCAADCQCPTPTYNESAEIEALRQQVQDLQAQLDAATSMTVAPSTTATSTAAVVESTITTSSTTTTETPQVETVEQFYADYVAASQAGNLTYLTPRVHPELLATYGYDQCNDAVPPDPAFDIQVEGIAGPADWSHRIDGIDFEFSDVYTVSVEMTDSLGTSRQDMHVGIVGDRLHWFTDCGDSLEPDIAAREGALVTIGGDTTSEVFDAPESWRVDVSTRDFCGVFVNRDSDGSTVEIKSGDSDFVMQIRESGRFYIETTGCDAATALEN